MQRLYGMGLRNFVYLGVGPVGCVPYVKAIPVWGARGCMANANNLARAYNSMFGAAMDAFRRRHADAKMVFVNIFNGFYITAAAKSTSVLYCTVQFVPSVWRCTLLHYPLAEFLCCAEQFLSFACTVLF